MSILNKLEKSQVVSINKSGNNFVVLEECDLNYEVRLTRWETIKLGLEIVFLALGKGS